MRFLVINGPNLNLLGTREPDVYGATTLTDLDGLVDEWASSLGAVAVSEQTNSEALIVDIIQGFDGDGIIINPGALTHTSRAIGDALRGVAAPAVEVHISNVKAREEWRATSLVADACVRTIYGRGIEGYRDALRHLANRREMPFETVAYGPHRDNVGDLRVGEGRAMVVLVHGGLWRQEYERDGTERLAVDLAARGYDTWNVEYRRRGQGGGWPAAGHDVLTALEFLPRLGRHPERVIVVSHSAGSYLSMWAGERSSTPVELHLALGPLLDLAGSVAGEDRCATDSRMMLAEGAPPVLAPGQVETVIVHGDADQIVPVDSSIAWAGRHGVEHHRTSCDHFSVLDPTTPEWEWARGRMEAAG